MTASDALFEREIQVREGERTHDREALRERAALARRDLRALALPNRSVVAIPSRGVAETIAFIAASLDEGLVPLPTATATPAPTRLPLSTGDVVIATSGSMGAPKYAEFRLEALLQNARLIARDLALSTADSVAVLQPLDHSYGLVGQLLAALVTGATLIDGRVAFADEQSARLRDATVVTSVSFTLRRLLDGGLDAQTVRVFGCAGGPFPAPLRELLLQRAPRARLVNQYGCTEAGPRIASCWSEDSYFPRGSVGAPLPGIAISLAEDGEILVRTPTAMSGYLGAPERSLRAWTEDGALRTGDVGRLEAGRLFIEGRKDDIVKVRGIKVSLAELTRTAESLGASAAFAATRSDSNGETSVVVLVEGVALTRRDFYGKIDPERVPDDVLVVQALPRLANGKLDRPAIRTIIDTWATPRPIRR